MSYEFVPVEYSSLKYRQKETTTSIYIAFIHMNRDKTLSLVGGGAAACAPERQQCTAYREFEVRLRPAATAADLTTGATNFGCAAIARRSQR